MVAISARYN